MAMQKTKALLDLYDRQTRTGRFDELSDEMREGIEEEIETQDHQEIRNNLQYESFKPRIARVLRDENKRDWEDRRRGAKGVRG